MSIARTQLMHVLVIYIYIYTYIKSNIETIHDVPHETTAWPTIFG